MSKKMLIVGGVAGGASAALGLEDLMRKPKSLCLKETNIFPLLIAGSPITLEKQ